MKKKVIFLLKHWEDIIAATALTTMTFAAVMNVITRYVFKHPFTWAEELYTYCVVMMVYLALAHLEGSGDQLCITAIDMWVKGKTGQRILNYIRGILTSAALVILGWHGIDVMLKAFKRSQVTYILHMPKGILYAVAMGSLFISVLVWVVLMICNKGDFDDA